MTTSERVAEIERMAFRAFPAEIEKRRGDWTLRATRLASNRRVNSATTPLRRAGDLAADLDAIERFYVALRRDPLLRVLSASPDAIDTAAAGRGYETEAETLVMVRTIGATGAPPATVPSSPGSAWLDAKAAWTPMSSESIEGWLGRITAIPGSAGFASIRDEAGVVAIGMGVVDGGWLGIFDVNTRPDAAGIQPDARGRGHATSVTATIIDWGVSQGAGAAYLQVMNGNEPALRLYRAAGFEESYRYWYRRAPAGADRDAATRFSWPHVGHCHGT